MARLGHFLFCHSERNEESIFNVHCSIAIKTISSAHPYIAHVVRC